MNLTRTATLTAASVAAMLAMPGAANALTCSDYFEAGTNVVDGIKNGSRDAPGYACNLGTNSNSSPDIATAIAAALGDGWSRLDKTDDNAVFNSSWPNPLTMTPSSGANFGSWSLASGIWGAYDRLVLVLKDGSFDPNGKDAPPAPIKWVWYEIKSGDYSGDWFLGNVINCKGSTGGNSTAGKKGKPGATASDSTGDDDKCDKNLSHGELFGFGDGQNDDPPNDVPEPGSLLLLSLGLLGLGAARRRS